MHGSILAFLKYAGLASGWGALRARLGTQAGELAIERGGIRRPLADIATDMQNNINKFRRVNNRFITATRRESAPGYLPGGTQQTQTPIALPMNAG